MALVPQQKLNKRRKMRNIIEQQKIKEAVRAIAIASGIDFVNNGTLIESHILYTRNDITERSGIVELIKAQDKKVDGVRNIDSARLNTGEAFICTGVAFSVASGREALANEGDFSKLDFQRTMSNRGVTAFFNNEFSLKISNKEKLNVIVRHGMQGSQTDEPMYNHHCPVTPFVIDQNQSILPQINCFQPVGTKDEPVVFEMALIGYRLTSN